MSTVFISYSHSDSGIASRIADDLRKDGIHVWIDEEGLKIGDILTSGLQQGLTSAKYLCVLLSPRSVASRWVLHEVSAALHEEIEQGTIRVLPVLLEDCTVPLFLKSKLFADLRNPSNYSSELRKLVDALGVEVASARVEVIVDQSYNQDGWYGEPTLAAGYSSVTTALGDVARCRSHGGGYKSAGALEGTHVLILPTPFRSLVDEHEYAEIGRWVQRGGGLMLLGFYLMEAHHYNNMNHLARRLGCEFRHDLLMPLGRETFQDCMAQAFAYEDRKLWIVTEPKGTDQNHLILQSVNNLALTSACSVESAERAELEVSTGDDIARLHAKGYKDPASGRLVRLTDYVLDGHSRASFLIARRYGRGRIVALGSWKTFLSEFLDDETLGNARLLLNCVRWLRGSGDDT